MGRAPTLQVILSRPDTCGSHNPSRLLPDLQKVVRDLLLLLLLHRHLLYIIYRQSQTYYKDIPNSVPTETDRSSVLVSLRILVYSFLYLSEAFFVFPLIVVVSPSTTPHVTSCADKDYALN